MKAAADRAVGGRYRRALAPLVHIGERLGGPGARHSSGRRRHGRQAALHMLHGDQHEGSIAGQSGACSLPGGASWRSSGLRLPMASPSLGAIQGKLYSHRA